ncbi:MAG: hydrogenase maturation protease [Bacteroidales bacterium]|nr:hydrogenase maturation protease [Bacteroidales bacterium]
MDKIKHLLSNDNLRIVFAGIGNVLRSDDGVGPFIAREIRSRNNRVVIIPETGVERYISAINREKPDVLIFIDCVNFEKEPGYWQAIPVEKVIDSTCHSHNISLNKLSEFFDSEIWVIGVQPSDLRVGEQISEPVAWSANEIISLINSF